MKVYEISLLVFLLEDIGSNDALYKIGSFIDSGMATVPELLELHTKNTYKNYCFNSLYPLEQDKVYKSNKTYTVKIRTIDRKLAEFFNNTLVNHYNSTMKGLTTSIKIIPQGHIEKIYSITPTVIKNDNGYWKGEITLSDFEIRLKENLIKKYNKFMDTKIDEDFQLYTSIEFTNKKPVAINYKGIKILGDKVTLNITDDKIAQMLAYMSLGTGLSEFNARGAGFMNYKFL